MQRLLASLFSSSAFLLSQSNSSTSREDERGFQLTGRPAQELPFRVEGALPNSDIFSPFFDAVVTIGIRVFYPFLGELLVISLIEVDTMYTDFFCS